MLINRYKDRTLTNSCARYDLDRRSRSGIHTAAVDTGSASDQVRAVELSRLYDMSATLHHVRPSRYSTWPLPLSSSALSSSLISGVIEAFIAVLSGCLDHRGAPASDVMNRDRDPSAGCTHRAAPSSSTRCLPGRHQRQRKGIVR